MKFIILLALTVASVTDAWQYPFSYSHNPYGYNMVNYQQQPALNYPMGNYQHQPYYNYPMANYQPQSHYNNRAASHQLQPQYNYPSMENYHRQPAQVYYVHHIISNLPSAKFDLDSSETETESDDMGFRSDSELLDGMSDDEIDERLYLLQTNTPYKRFNNFLQTMYNLRTQYRRRWKNGLRKTQHSATHNDNSY